MADRQSNTHQPTYKIINSFRGKTFTRNMYKPDSGSGKMKELIRTKTPFTDWDLNLNNTYRIRNLIDTGINTVSLSRPTETLPSDSLLSPNGLWPFSQVEKYSGSIKQDTIYYYDVSEVAAGELPWEYTAYNSKGTIVAKYIINIARDSDTLGTFSEEDWGKYGAADCSTTKGHMHTTSFIDINKKIRNDKTLKEELLAFVATHNLTLPDHDIEDSRMYQIGVEYAADGTTPTTIQYFIHQLRDIEGGRLTGS
jgi:hypothetical protein